ncbi:TIGR04211 family SH3 domain-containing protein [Paraferrimonas sp. SM1919]|uniref:TIGR04211 family SH3 domain-containing protein n=1 Tax=Paraferrimonas sp. SM1919 TaxID=2662263 RepID=UPI0013D77BB2|nr:TIGR04211 family SH3 domain-containing protein [Paraferrimonas sp. SM1919]
MKRFLFVALFTLSSLILTPASANANGYISDDIYIFMHAGPGKNYRIVGSIEAGMQVSVTGNQGNNFMEVTDSKGRKGWIESQWYSKNKSFRQQVASFAKENKLLTEKLQRQQQTASTSTSKLNEEIDNLSSQLAELRASFNSQSKEVETLTTQRDSAVENLQQYQAEHKFRLTLEGAMIAGVGILVGIILVYLPRPRKSRHGNPIM